MGKAEGDFLHSGLGNSGNMAVLKEKTVRLLRELQAHDHFENRDRDSKSYGRIYYLKENGTKQYVRHDPIAMLMRSALLEVDYSERRIYVSISGEILLKEFDADLSV